MQTREVQLLRPCNFTKPGPVKSHGIAAATAATTMPDTRQFPARRRNEWKPRPLDISRIRVRLDQRLREEMWVVRGEFLHQAAGVLPFLSRHRRQQFAL